MHAASQSLHGLILSFNLSPKGVPEGILLRLKEGPAPVVQVNFPPELAGQVTQLAGEGDLVSIDVVPFRDAEADTHPVFELLKLSLADGRSITAEGAPEADVVVRGVVKRINHARRGEPNGAILDTGDFVHLRPHGAKQIGLKLGQQIEAAGEVRAGWSGHRVIEAHTANGVAIEKPHKPKKHDEHGPKKHHPQPHHHPPHGPKHEPAGKH